MKGDRMKLMVNIPKDLTQGEDLIVLRKSEFDDLRRRFKELTDAFSKIKRGEKEFKDGKTKIISSLAEIH